MKRKNLCASYCVAVLASIVMVSMAPAGGITITGPNETQFTMIDAAEGGHRNWGAADFGNAMPNEQGDYVANILVQGRAYSRGSGTQC